MPNKYDVIVIGAGIGGLAVASLLSKDRKVLVLEKNHTLGGYCSNFKRNGFTFESAVQSVNGLYRGSPVYEILNRSQALKGVNIVCPANLYRSIFPDYDIVVPQANISQYKDLLYSIFPNESNGINDLFATFKCIYDEMGDYYRTKVLKRSPYIVKYCRRSLQELMDSFIKSRELQAIISQYWMYRGLPPDRFSAITFAYIWYDYTVNGSYFPESGMWSIIDSLVMSIKSNNGEVRGGDKVSKLCVSTDTITELVREKGERIRAETIISNIDLFKTFEMLSGEDERTMSLFVKKLHENSLSISAFKIYLGLGVDVKDAGVTDYEIFINPSYDVSAMYSSSMSNDFKNVPFSVTIYSNISDSFCKKGNSVVSISALSGYDYWQNMTVSEYEQKKQECADVMLDRCEKVIPGLRTFIKVKVIATPLTMERYTGNSRGAIYGWNKSSLIDEIRFINPTTPIKNLLLASHWTKMGGGIGGVLLSSDRTYDIIRNKERRNS